LIEGKNCTLGVIIIGRAFRSFFSRVTSDMSLQEKNSIKMLF
jgi:hypothetical protein